MKKFNIILSMFIDTLFENHCDRCYELDFDNF